MSKQRSKASEDPRVMKEVSEDDSMEMLTGGRTGKIFQQERCVYRPAGPWTKQVHALLQHLRNEGFYAALKRHLSLI